MARYALVIGITKYKSSLGNLPKAAGDAEAVAQLLETHGNFQVTRLPSYFNETKKSFEMVPEAVTGAQLGQALQEFLLKRAKNSDALIYYTGHGITIANKVGRSKGYLATSDEDPLELGSLNELILDSELKSLVVLLDCCYSGSFLESNLLQQTLTAFTAQKDYYFITASRGFEPSYAVPSEAHSIFTGALLAGLSQNNTDIRGRVSGDRLFDYISQEPTVSGQEPIRLGWGKAIEIVCYPVESIPKTTVILNRQNPYQGLKDFESDKASYFFGRQTAVRVLLDRLSHSRFLAVVGASGCGKSSLVKAGLLPKLADNYFPGSNQWQIELIKPGDRPLTILQEILVRRHQNDQPFILFIDQFEEVFTLCKNETERQAFIRAVTTEATAIDRQTRVIVTIRGDFIQRCADYPETAILINREKTTTYFVTNLNHHELEDAIEQPALLHGVEFERGLVALIANDVEDQPGALPLLQYALKELWRVCIEESTSAQLLLTKAGYEKIGGVKGALEKRANFVYQNLNDTDKTFVKSLFLELVEVEENQPVTRRRATWEKLEAQADSEEQVQRIVGLLADQRLIVTSDRTLEVAHEALLTEWKLLANWIEQDYENIRLSRRLEAACLEWQKFEKSEDALLSGELLNLISEWYNRTQFRLLYQDLEFLQKSIEKRDREQKVQLERERQLRELAEAKAEAESQKAIAEMEKAVAAEDKAKAEAEKANEARAKIKIQKQHSQLVLLFSFLALILVSLIARLQTQRTQEANISAVKANIESAQILLKMNHQIEALLETAKALKKIESLDTGSYKTIAINTIDSIVPQIHERNRLEAHELSVNTVTFSPTDPIIASASSDKKVILWHTNGTIYKILTKHIDKVLTVNFSNDGKYLLSAGSDRNIIIWNNKGEYIMTIKGHTKLVSDVKFSPNNQLIASASDDSTVKVWKVNLEKKDYQLYKSLSKHKDAVTSVEYSPNGKYIASTSDDGTVILWEQEGKYLTTLDGHSKEQVKSAAFSRDNQSIISVGFDKKIIFWKWNVDPITNQIDIKSINKRVFTKDVDRPYKVSFSPNYNLIASINNIEQSVHVYDLYGNLKFNLLGHKVQVNSFSFSPNSKDIVSSSRDKTVRIWNLDNKQPESQPLNLNKVCLILKHYLDTHKEESNNNVCPN